MSCPLSLTLPSQLLSPCTPPARQPTHPSSQVPLLDCVNTGASEDNLMQTLRLLCPSLATHIPPPTLPPCCSPPPTLRWSFRCLGLQEVVIVDRGHILRWGRSNANLIPAAPRSSVKASDTHNDANLGIVIFLPVSLSLHTPAASLRFLLIVRMDLAAVGDSSGLCRVSEGKESLHWEG